MNREDYEEPLCPFDASMWKNTPDTSGAAQIPVPEIMSRLDALYNADRAEEGTSLLEHWRGEAKRLGDWRGEVSMLSEMMGHYRKRGDREKGLDAVNAGLALIREHNLGETVSGATIILNAATTMKAFGLAERTISMFTDVCRVFAGNLPPDDYRFAGLYNNMALSYQDVGDFDTAESYFRRALDVLERLGNRSDEQAVTWCNLAVLYERKCPDNPEVDEALAFAWEALDDDATEQNGYHAFNMNKCAPVFRRFGYGQMAAELEARARRIYERN